MQETLKTDNRSGGVVHRYVHPVKLKELCMEDVRILLLVCYRQSMFKMHGQIWQYLLKLQTPRPFLEHILQRFHDMK